MSRPMGILKRPAGFPPARIDEARRWFSDTPKAVLGEIVVQLCALLDDDSYDASIESGRWLDRAKRESELIREALQKK